jgi:hypothetical protein
MRSAKLVFRQNFVITSMTIHMWQRKLYAKKKSFDTQNQMQKSFCKYICAIFLQMLTNKGLGFRVCLPLVWKKAFSKGALR